MAVGEDVASVKHDVVGEGVVRSYRDFDEFAKSALSTILTSPDMVSVSSLCC